MVIGHTTSCDRMSLSSDICELEGERVDLQYEAYGCPRAMPDRGTIRAHILSIPGRGDSHPALSPFPLPSTVPLGPTLCS